MRRKQGVDLSPGDPIDKSYIAGINVYVMSWRQHSATLQDVPQWYELGGRCSICPHAALLDRWEIARRYGRKRFIITLEPKLRCTRCGNREANDFVLVKIPR